MLQIIGWLGCFYLVVKSLEMAANPTFRDENGKMTPAALRVAFLGWIGAVGFALWLAAQGNAALTPKVGQPSTALTPSQIECIENAKTPSATIACTDS